MGCQNQAAIIEDGKTWGLECERRFKELLGSKLIQFMRLHSTIIPPSFFSLFLRDFPFLHRVMNDEDGSCLRIIEIFMAKIHSFKISIIPFHHHHCLFCSHFISFLDTHPSINTHILNKRINLFNPFNILS